MTPWPFVVEAAGRWGYSSVGSFVGAVRRWSRSSEPFVAGTGGVDSLRRALSAAVVRAQVSAATADKFGDRHGLIARNEAEGPRRVLRARPW